MSDAALKQEFETNGFVVLRNYIQGNELDSLRTQLDRLIRDVVPTMPPEHVFCEEKGRLETLKQLQMLHTHDSFFRELFLGGRIEKLAELLLDDGVVGKNLQYFSKPPRTGQATPPHQDGFYFKLTPCEALTMWLALDEVDHENGCVCYVRGSNRKRLRAHQQSGVLGFSQVMTDYGLPEHVENEVHVPAEPGDLLVHHALTIHRAGANQSSNRLRRSLGFIFFGRRAKPDEFALSNYQKKLKDELTATGRI
jgi:phytanoyl-CoA hydroxylase